MAVPMMNSGKAWDDYRKGDFEDCVHRDGAFRDFPGAGPDAGLAAPYRNLNDGWRNALFEVGVLSSNLIHLRFAAFVGPA
jgi:hypothetical protein